MTDRAAPLVFVDRAMAQRELDRQAYTTLWNEFGKAIKMGIVEDTANRFVRPPPGGRLCARGSCRAPHSSRRAARAFFDRFTRSSVQGSEPPVPAALCRSCSSGPCCCC